jgi:hypothetical protein
MFFGELEKQSVSREVGNNTGIAYVHIRKHKNMYNTGIVYINIGELTDK